MRVEPVERRPVGGGSLDAVDRAPFSSVGELLQALEILEDVPSDDVVAALPHLLQTAELLASAHPDDAGLIAAGLVHDLASSLDDGVADHAAAGARLVAPLLGERVANLVAGHTDAKRYLVTAEPAYAGFLSANSTFTLDVQGGCMAEHEVASFVARPGWADMVVLRRADDAAKRPGRRVRPAAAWRALLDEVAFQA
jgi:predicted HD phosphohydrolase